MIKHIVLWRVKGETPEQKKANALTIKRALEGLQGKIPGLLTLEVGIDFESLAESSDVSLYTEFSSRDALERYHSHPEHELVKPVVRDLRCERRVIDYEVTDA